MKQTRRSQITVLYHLASAFLIAMLFLTGCGKSGAPAPGKAEAAGPAKPVEPIAVRVATADSRRIERAISVTGSLLPDETVTVNSELIGKVTSIRVDFGQSIRKGEILAEIDKQEYQLQYERAKAALAQALARLGLNPGQENDPPTATPAVRQAQARLEDVKFKYDSAAKLVKSGDISQDRFNELDKSYRAQAAAYDQARDEMRTQWAAMESIRAEMRLAQKKLNDATLRAPFDGAVSQKHVSPGQYVRENAPIVTLVKTNPLRLRVEVPETAAGRVKAGTTLTFTTDALPGEKFQAIVRETNPSLDARSRSLTVEARIARPDPRLRPGMFAQVRLVLEAAVDTLMVPKQSLYSIAGLTKLFAIRDGKAVEIKVTPGDEVDGWLPLVEGTVNPGETVAVSQQALLVNGSPVRVAGNK
jgi:RND family efflux transporter MFP subunit